MDDPNARSPCRRDREVYPHVTERIGEDPARFLDRDLAPDGLRFIAARINGIDRLAVIGGWQGVEEHLLRTPQRGRDAIKSRLHRRARELEDHGERDDHLEGVDERIAERRAGEDGDGTDRVLWRHEPCGSLEVERASRVAWFCRACEQSTNRVEPVGPGDVEAEDLPAAHDQLQAGVADG